VDDDAGPWDLRLNDQRKDALVGKSPLGLTAREFQVLAALVRNEGHVVSATALLEAMWGTAEVGDVHPVHVYISRLRKKLQDGGLSGHLIETVRGHGYLYSTPAHGPLISAGGVQLDYDHRLILRAIDPGDRPFLGWQPAEVIDTFFMLTAVSVINSNRKAALAIAHVWAAIGIHSWNGPTAIRCADGTITSYDIHLSLTTRKRRFLGMRASIRPWNPIL